MRHEHAARTTPRGHEPACNTPGCHVLDGLTFLPHADPDDAVGESERLHREAEHGPTEDGWRYSAGRGWFAANAEGI